MKFINLSRLIVTALVLLCVSSSTRADRIVTRQTTYEDVTIIDLQRDSLLYQTPSDTFNNIPIDDILLIGVDSEPGLRDFNKAELFRKSRRYNQAITYYERAERLADGHWLKLVQARLIQVLDLGNRIDLLVDRLLGLLIQSGDPALAAALLPEHAPDGNRGVQSASRRLRKELQIVDDSDRRLIAQLLDFHIADRTNRSDITQLAKRLASQPLPPNVSTAAAYRIRLRVFRRLSGIDQAVDAFQAAVAIDYLNRDIASAPEAVLPEVLMLKSELLAETATTDASLYDAALVAMRVAIHYPQNPLAPVALRRAADIHERLNRHSTALRLLQESLDHPRTPEPLRVEIAKEIDRLRAAG